MWWRRVVWGSVAAFAFVVVGVGPVAAKESFPVWLASFRVRALAAGVSPDTWASSMTGLAPDERVFDDIRQQPEFTEALWQYLNRRVSEWRIAAGSEKLREHGELLRRIERDYGVPPAVMLGLWGIESAYGDPVVYRNHARPVIPSLAALAWGEPRRRAYWDRQLIDALRIVDHGWAVPDELRGSWAGAMGHTQWMPDTWLTIGLDYDGDGRVSPFGAPADALASSARFLVQRGKYRRGEPWGCEVRVPDGFRAGEKESKSYAAWTKAGLTRADGAPFPRADATARLWQPATGGPAFLLEPNFYAIYAYNPSMSYALALLHLGDRVVGGLPFVQTFPGSERPPTLVEIQEIQRRLTALGFDTGGADGRVGAATRLAAQSFQRAHGMQPADGYVGVTLLEKLRGVGAGR